MIGRLISKLTPRHVRNDNVTYSRAKNLMGVVLVSCIASPFYAVIFYLLNQPRSSAAILIEWLMIIMSALIYKYTRSLLLAASMLVTTLMVLLIWLTVNLGGMFSPAACWLVLPPLIAYFFGDIRSGIATSVVTIFAIVVILVEQTHGQIGMVIINESNILLQASSIIGLMLVILALSYIYEIETFEWSAEVFSKNLKLEDARQSAEVADREINRLLIEIGNSETKLKSILEGAPDAMIISDESGVIVMVNAQAEIIFGYTKEEILGKQVEFLIPYRFHQRHTLHRKSYLAEPQLGLMGQGLDLFGLRNNGNEFPIEVSLSPVETREGKLVLAAIRDVTEKRKMDKMLIEKNIELVKASQAKDEFLAHMSHELRTPLNGMIAMTQLLIESDVTGEYKEQLNIINESESHLLAVINQILDFSKIESGVPGVEHLRFNLRDMINKIQKVYELKARVKHLLLTCQIEDDVPEYFTGDAMKIRQVLANILDNAVKFTQSGQIHIGVSLQEANDPISYIKFEITDTGIGIARDVLPRLFTPFLQGDSSMTRKYGGTGLGLAISKNLVELMGGAIALESNETGSKFYFVIPFIHQHHDMIAKKMRDITSEALNCDIPGKARILIVEDNILNQSALKLLLENFGYHVVIAGDGRRALALLERESFDMILMDCQMPDLDGYKTTIEIRKREYGTKTRIAIVGVTAHAQEYSRQKCMESGMDDFIARPYNIVDLYSLVQEWLKKK